MMDGAESQYPCCSEYSHAVIENENVVLGFLCSVLWTISSILGHLTY